MTVSVESLTLGFQALAFPFFWDNVFYLSQCSYDSSSKHWPQAVFMFPNLMSSETSDL